MVALGETGPAEAKGAGLVTTGIAGFGFGASSLLVAAATLEADIKGLESDAEVEASLLWPIDVLRAGPAGFRGVVCM